MAVVDLVNEAISAQALHQAVTTTTQGTYQDFHDSNISLNAFLSVGAVSGTSPSVTIQIEESNTTNSGFTVIPNMIFAAVTTTSTTPQVIRGLSSKQYVRANAVTVSGTSPSVDADVILVSNRVKYPDSATGSDQYPSS